MVTYTTIAGWAIVLGVTGSYAVYSRKRAGRRTKLSRKELDVQQKTRALSVGEKSGKAAEKPPAKKKAKKAPTSPSVPEPESNVKTDFESGKDDEVDNREFARQLTAKKSGTILPAKSQAGGASRQKSVKQSKAQEKPAARQSSPDTTAPSSAAGGDADDDQSSAFNSPELSATSNETPVPNSGISDMLEAPAAGPSVLKITAPTNPAPPKKSKAPAAFEPAESKKQRQNRKKAEQKKLEREAEEKDRKVKAEQQRRTARQAEGRAAKDGSTFMASQAPTTSAWSDESKSTVKEAPKPGNDLLDTFDTSKKAANPVDQSDDGSTTAASEWEKVLNVGTSEEEAQRKALESYELKKAMEDSSSDTNWKTVKSKKSRKPITQNEVDELSKKDEPKEADHKYMKENKSDPPKVQEKPSNPGQKWNVTTESHALDGKVDTGDLDVQDSEWEV